MRSCRIITEKEMKVQKALEHIKNRKEKAGLNLTY